MGADRASVSNSGSGTRVDLSGLRNRPIAVSDQQYDDSDHLSLLHAALPICLALAVEIRKTFPTLRSVTPTFYSQG